MDALHELLRAAVEMGASTVHLKEGSPPVLRIKGKLKIVDTASRAAGEVTRLAMEILPPHLRERFASAGVADFLLQREANRFRANIFRGDGAPALTFRHVKTTIPGLDELHLPADVIQRLAALRQGLVLVVGLAGCGKSTTIAAILQRINQTQRRRIITIEEPVEYVFNDQKSFITQREVGIDVPSFGAALKHMLYQDPDVVMISELQDLESVKSALNMAERGRLVLASLHVDAAWHAIAHMANYFPPAERDMGRMRLANSLQVVLCQWLVPTVKEECIPVMEVLFNTPVVCKWIEKNDLEKLRTAMEAGGEDDLRSVNESLYALIKSGMITREVGLAHSNRPDILKPNLDGVFYEETKRILS